MTSLRFQKKIDLAAIPSEWNLARLTIDWMGRPLLLFVEGKPPQPDFRVSPEAFSHWYRTPPKAHHLVYPEAEKLRSIAFDHSQGLSTFHVQPLHDGWLLGERRGGRSMIYDPNGSLRATLDLGDASEDLQTTADGRIWVSYFDEGVFGAGIGRQGLVCFDTAGTLIFKYADYAEENGLPMICDCYAMNADDTGAVWINYYMDFPLVRLRDFKLERAWENFGVLGNSFALGRDEVIFMRNHVLAIRSLKSSPDTPSRILEAKDQNGNAIEVIDQQYHLSFAARGTSLAINTGTAIYTLCE